MSHVARRNPHLNPTPHRFEERAARCCAWPHCERKGEYRAPKARDRLREYFWFCLEHVRAYNGAWDFFKGMNAHEIEAYLKEDVTWHRPTWRFGTGPDGKGGFRFVDPFEMFQEGGGGFEQPTDKPAPASIEARMLKVMELDEPVSMAELKLRYKELAKRHHPDLHGGDRAAEEKLKTINQAYDYLRNSSLYREPA